MTNAQERALQAYPASCRITERTCYKMGYEQAIKDLTSGAITVSVWTNDAPKSIFAKNEDWDACLGQFYNGQRVKLILLPNE